MFKLHDLILYGNTTVEIVGVFPFSGSANYYLVEEHSPKRRRFYLLLIKEDFNV